MSQGCFPFVTDPNCHNNNQHKIEAIVPLCSRLPLVIFATRVGQCRQEGQCWEHLRCFWVYGSCKVCIGGRLAAVRCMWGASSAYWALLDVCWVLLGASWGFGELP